MDALNLTRPDPSNLQATTLYGRNTDSVSTLGTRGTSRAHRPASILRGTPPTGPRNSATTNSGSNIPDSATASTTTSTITDSVHDAANIRAQRDSAYALLRMHNISIPGGHLTSPSSEFSQLSTPTVVFQSDVFPISNQIQTRLPEQPVVSPNSSLAAGNFQQVAGAGSS